MAIVRKQLGTEAVAGLPAYGGVPDWGGYAAARGRLAGKAGVLALGVVACAGVAVGLPAATEAAEPAAPPAATEVPPRETFRPMEKVRVGIYPSELGKLTLHRQTEITHRLCPPDIPSTPGRGGGIRVPCDPIEFRPAPDSPVGADLGNGIVVDRNGNIHFFPYAAYEGGLVNPNFKNVTIDPPGFNTTVERTGEGRWKVTDGGLFSDTESSILTQGDGYVLMETNGHGVTYVLDPSDSSGGNRAWVVRHSNSPQSEETISRSDDGKAIVVNHNGSQTVIARTENGMTVRSPGLFGESIATVTFDGKELVIDPPGWEGKTVITKEGNTIKVNGVTITLEKGKIVIDGASIWGTTDITVE